MVKRMTLHRKLLTDFAEKGSEDAFRQLVNLYIGMVHSSAVRLVNGDVHRAQDITQTVFADLARHAHTISAEATLGGWLHRRTCHVATNMMRGERRRQNRERQAVEMNALHENPDETLAQIAPVLDEAIEELKTPDREAIMLRFFERCDFRTIGQALGSNEDATQKRVTRALEKLRVLLARRGVVLSGTALALALGSEATHAAPVGLAATISTTALTSAHLGTGLTSTTLKIMAMTKLKMTVIAAVSALILAGGVTTVVVLNHETDYAAEYTPPPHPNMQQILMEAQNDTAAGRYREALAKLVWFQKNALKYDPSMVGVRSSFALMYLGQLAQKYPPAMKKIISMRDEDVKIIRKTNVDLKAAREVFAELASINNSLKEDEKTVECFKWLDSQNPSLAKSVFPFADRALIAAKKYKLYGRYIEPDSAYARMVEVYNVTKKSAASSKNDRMQAIANKMFSNKVATMVGILAMNDRNDDATRIATKAVKELSDPAFLSELEEAKNGVVPPTSP